MNGFTRALRLALAETGPELSEAALESLAGYCQKLEKAGERLNLTAVRGTTEVAAVLAAVSLSPVALGLLDKSDRIIDVGTGAGFPGVPVGLALEPANMTVCDSVKKKIAFVAGASAGTGIKAIAARAETLPLAREHRAAYDAVLARAVAEIRVIAEYAAPLLKPGGRLIAYKGESAETELKAAGNAFAKLGLACRETLTPGPVRGKTYKLVVIEKTGETPEIFPRPPGIAKKRPL